METFVLLHDSRGGNLSIISTHSVGLKAQKPFPSTEEVLDEDDRLCARLHRCAGFDHGVGHSLLLLYDAKAPYSQNGKYFNGLYHYPFNTLYKFILN